MMGLTLMWHATPYTGSLTICLSKPVIALAGAMGEDAVGQWVLMIFTGFALDQQTSCRIKVHDDVSNLLHFSQCHLARCPTGNCNSEESSRTIGSAAGLGSRCEAVKGV
jgi:hypothetical protein